jgi:hypothetical protein
MATNQPGALDAATDLFLVENRASSDLDGSITDVATAITVTDGTVFPGAGRFKITIENEVIDIASRSGNVLTAELRAAEGTTGVAHADAAVVGMQFTKGHYETVRDAIINTQEGAMRRPDTSDSGPTVQKVGRDPLEQVRRFAL